MVRKLLLSSLVLLLVSKLAFGQSTSNDFFPLSVGNCWTYKYQTSEWDMSDVYRFDNGIAIYTILSVSSTADSIIWTFKESRDIVHSVHYYFPGPDTSYAVKDSTTFQIIEYNIGNHRLTRIGYIADFWKSVFPFASELTDTNGFYRYYPNIFPDTVSSARVDPRQRPEYSINTVFKRSTGLEKIAYSTQNITGYSAITNHVFQSSVLTSVETKEPPSVPYEFSLDQNYPNPFNPQTTIPFQTAKEARVSIRIYDVLGRIVSTVYDVNIQAGNHAVRWFASGQSSVVYLCVVNVNGVSKAIRLVLLK